MRIAHNAHHAECVRRSVFKSSSNVWMGCKFSLKAWQLEPPSSLRLSAHICVAFFCETWNLSKLAAGIPQTLFLKKILGFVKPWRLWTPCSDWTQKYFFNKVSEYFYACLSQQTLCNAWVPFLIFIQTQRRTSGIERPTDLLSFVSARAMQNIETQNRITTGHDLACLSHKQSHGPCRHWRRDH